MDKVSFSLAVFLIFIGAMLVLSASPSAAHRDRLADDFAFIKKQGVFIFMGLVLMIGVSMNKKKKKQNKNNTPTNNKRYSASCARLPAWC